MARSDRSTLGPRCRAQALPRAARPRGVGVHPDHRAAASVAPFRTTLILFPPGVYMTPPHRGYARTMDPGPQPTPWPEPNPIPDPEPVPPVPDPEPLPALTPR